MEKTMTISRKKVRFVADGRLPILYRQCFPANNFFADIMKLTNSRFDAEVIVRFGYTMAKAADPSIGELMDWLATFDDPLAFYRNGGPAVDIARLVIGSTDREETDEESEGEQTTTDEKNAEAGDH